MTAALTRRALLASGAALTLAATLPRGFAQAPAATVYTPYAVGGFSVMPLLDGLFPLQMSMIPSADSPAGAELLEEAHRPAKGPSPEPVNGFAVKRGGKTILIDAGSGTIFGPEMGHLEAALEQTGATPDSIETVLLTHLHADHAGGLLGEGGAARFPNAEVVVQESEIAFWSDDGNLSRATDAIKPMFAPARAVLAAYKGRLRPVNGHVELAPGMRAVPLPGHSVGHSGVMIEDGGEALLIWGDIIHSTVLQLPNPAWTVIWDGDPALAASTRARVLDMVATDGLAVAGAHMTAHGRIGRRGSGYAFKA